MVHLPGCLPASVTPLPGMMGRRVHLRDTSLLQPFREPFICSAYGAGDDAGAPFDAPVGTRTTSSHRRDAPSRPGHTPGRGHSDPAADRTPERWVVRVIDHLGAGIRLPARPGGVGGNSPPTTVVACPSPHR